MLHTLIFEVGKLLSHSGSSFHERLQQAVVIIARYFRVEKCSVMIINREDMTLEVGAATHTEIIGMKRNLSDVTIATRALLDDVPFETDSQRLSYFVAADTTTYTSSYSLSLPIKYSDKKLGVLNLADTIGCERLTNEQMEEAVELNEQLAVHLYVAQADALLEREIKKYEDAVARLIKADEMKTSLTSFIVHDL
ncbi:MAG: GAF domain-containing protein, partial [Dissulfurispiraceae bacterium]